jgi:hypothetical protein
MNPALLPFFLAPTVALSVEASPPPSQPVAPFPQPEVLELPEISPKELQPMRLDTGRPPLEKPEPDLIRLTLHGEYQVRYNVERSFPMTPTASAVNARPSLVGDSLGQNQWVNHWLRVTPRFSVNDQIEIVAQLDLTGLVVGEVAHDVSTDRTARDSYNGFSNVDPRWLYADIHTKVGLLRVGQQPSHWGLGLIANDGDHSTTFGDYRYGAVNERILFATKPGGKDSDVTVAVAGDLVFRDNTARLADGDHAFQGVLAAIYEKKNFELGVYGVYRNQQNDRKSGGNELLGYTDKLEVGVLDVFGQFTSRVPGVDAYLFGGVEAATIFGSTNYIRTVDQTASGTQTLVRSYGGAAQLGVVHVSRGEREKRLLFQDDVKGKRPQKYGDIVAQLEIGYASGDADPLDGTERRFTFDPNHKIGLLLFDEVLRFQTARAANAAKDPLLSNGSRPSPGIDLYPSQGGVFGAQYINPTGIYRPRPWLDLKAGAVIAQTTADVVDPYRLVLTGNYVNARGGDPKKHDLGVELDAGVEVRGDLDRGLVGTLGAQGGVLFPGGALSDAGGATYKTPWITMARLGVMF